jgi:hypothetical protein
MSKKFYIFLDIDGVMFDWDYILSKPKKGGLIQDFNPESVKALNKLMSDLSTEYRPELVITSTWRSDMFAVYRAFRDNGVAMSRNIHITSTRLGGDPRYRGKEILDYMGGTTEDRNFVIIDDESFDFDKYFDKSSIIKTEMFHGSLNTKMVDNYLESIGIEPSEDIM